MLTFLFIFFFRLNTDLKVSEFCCALESSNALGIIKRFDVVIDASDNIATRYLLNDACVLSGKPLVSGSDRWKVN